MRDPGVWIEVDKITARVSLLPCEGPHQCRADPDCNASGTQLPALCGQHHVGYLCASCEDGYEKVGARCKPCQSTSWTSIAVIFVAAVFTSAIIFKHSLSTVCPLSSAERVYSAVDTNASGSLDREKVKNLLQLIGDPRHSRDDYVEKVLQQMVGASATQGTEVKQYQFILWCEAYQPTASFSIAVFFLQTLSELITISLNKERGETQNFLQVINLQPAHATGVCLMPDLPMIAPLLISALTSALIAAIDTTIYYSIQEFTDLDMRRSNLNRCLLNVALFSFMPLTKVCISFLLCRDINGTYYLGSDLSVKCWSGEHRNVAIVAGLVLASVGIGMPVYLYLKVRRFMLEHGPVAQAQQDARHEFVAVLTPRGFDPLFRYSRNGAWGWSIFMLVLKLSINVVITLGTVYEFPWAAVLQLLLFSAAVAAHHAQPFASEILWLPFCIYLNIVADNLTSLLRMS